MKSIVKSPWEFACAWYQPDSVRRGIQDHRAKVRLGDERIIPEDVYSPEFAEWLTEQYRLAMTKGAQLAIAEMKARGEA